MVNVFAQLLTGSAGAVVSLVSLVPYFVSVKRGTTKPHVFSWILWTLLTWIAFVIQVTAGAGPGAWATGVAALFTTAIAIIAIPKGEKNITRSDGLTFFAGLAAIPLWIGTHNSAASAVLVTLIDCLGFYPTLRKSWLKPREEFLYTHSLSLIKHALSIAALSIFSIPTAFYPAGLFLMNIILVGIIISRRRYISGKPEPLIKLES